MEVLTHPQIALGGHNRGMAEGELDLLERGLALMGQFGEGTAQIMGG